MDVVRLRHVLCWKRTSNSLRLSGVSLVFESLAHSRTSANHPTLSPDVPRHLGFWVKPDLASIPSSASQHHPGLSLQRTAMLTQRGPAWWPHPTPQIWAPPRIAPGSVDTGIWSQISGAEETRLLAADRR